MLRLSSLQLLFTSNIWTDGDSLFSAEIPTSTHPMTWMVVVHYEREAFKKSQTSSDPGVPGGAVGLNDVVQDHQVVIIRDYGTDWIVV